MINLLVSPAARAVTIKILVVFLLILSVIWLVFSFKKEVEAEVEREYRRERERGIDFYSILIAKCVIVWCIMKLFE